MPIKVNYLKEFKLIVGADNCISDPSIIKKLDLRVENVLGFEVFLDNVPASRKKIRESKSQFVFSDFQKVFRDYAFVVDETYSSGEIISLVKSIDEELIKEVKIFDVYQG